MKTVKLIVLLIALALLATSLGTPEWQHYSSSIKDPNTSIQMSSSLNMGLWETCASASGDGLSKKQCQEIQVPKNSMGEKLQAVRAFSIISCIAIIAAIVCMYTCQKMPYLTTAMLGMAIASSAISIGVYVSLVNDEMQQSPASLGLSKLEAKDFGYSFWLQVAGLGTVLLATILCFVKSKKMK